MRKTNISNTLWNDTQEGVLGYASQIKDAQLNEMQGVLNKTLTDAIADMKEKMTSSTVQFNENYPGLLEMTIKSVY